MGWDGGVQLVLVCVAAWSSSPDFCVEQKIRIIAAVFFYFPLLKSFRILLEVLFSPE